ncbi:MAG TPA: DUF4112 domain-containing protein [Gemmatimonadaceae bacterium]|nr:DUF4112 domain-containing protein [Gemmatimonadaceae bacterium]
MPTDDPLARARTLTNLLDNAVRVPGTSMRFGLDPVLGLIPGLGDVAGAALGGYVVLLASQLGAPTTVIVRMLGNVVIDTVGGTVPVIGDLFDAGWKSNSRNLALLERHLGKPESTKRASRAVVWLTVAALVLLAVGSVVVAVLLVRALFQTFA